MLSKTPQFLPVATMEVRWSLRVIERRSVLALIFSILAILLVGVALSHQLNENYAAGLCGQRTERLSDLFWRW